MSAARSSPWRCNFCSEYFPPVERLQTHRGPALVGRTYPPKWEMCGEALESPTGQGRITREYIDRVLNGDRRAPWHVDKRRGLCTRPTGPSTGEPLRATLGEFAERAACSPLEVAGLPSTPIAPTVAGPPGPRSGSCRVAGADVANLVEPPGSDLPPVLRSETRRTCDGIFAEFRSAPLARRVRDRGHDP